MRASRSRSAAARRWRFSRPAAGVMSRSSVERGNPWRRAAAAPMRTKLTRCFASALRICSGSTGATTGGARCSATPRLVQEPREVLQLFQALLRRKTQDTRHIVEHVRSHNDACLDGRVDFKIDRCEQPLERVPRRAGQAAFDPGDGGLGGAGPLRQGALAEAGAGARLTEQFGSGGHAVDDSKLAITGKACLTT